MPLLEPQVATVAILLLLLGQPVISPTNYTTSTRRESESDAKGAKLQPNILKTQAAFFIEASPMLSRESPIHDRLWDGVARIRAPMTMYSPWAPYPHYCVGELTPPTNNGRKPCVTSWNMTLMDTMIDDYINATRAAFSDQKKQTEAGPFYEFTQSPCWMWKDGDCKIPTNVHSISRPSHKVYAAGVLPVDASYTQIADYYGQLAAYYRTGSFVDECGAVHKNPRPVQKVRYWGIENEGEHGASHPGIMVAMYDAIVQGIRRHESGREAPMKYLAVNQNFEGNTKTIDSTLRYFLNRSNHARRDVPIDAIAFHGYFHGTGTLGQQ